MAGDERGRDVEARDEVEERRAARPDVLETPDLDERHRPRPRCSAGPTAGSANGVPLRTIAKRNAQEQAEHEDRHRDAEVGDDHRPDVDRGVAAIGRERARAGCRPTTAKRIARIVSSIVVGSRSMRSSVTGRECLIECPDRPWTSWSEVERRTGSGSAGRGRSGG